MIHPQTAALLTQVVGLIWPPSKPVKFQNGQLTLVLISSAVINHQREDICLVVDGSMAWLLWGDAMLKERLFDATFAVPWRSIRDLLLNFLEGLRYLDLPRECEPDVAKVNERLDWFFDGQDL